MMVGKLPTVVVDIGLNAGAGDTEQTRSENRIKSIKIERQWNMLANGKRTVVAEEIG